MNKGAKLMEARARIRERRAQLRQDTIERTAAAPPVGAAQEKRIDNAPAGPEELSNGAKDAAATAGFPAMTSSRPLSSRARELSVNTAGAGVTGLSADETGPGAIQLVNEDDERISRRTAAAAAAAAVNVASAPASPPRSAAIPALSSAAVTPPRPSADAQAATSAPSSVEKPVYQKGFFGGAGTRMYFIFFLSVENKTVPLSFPEMPSNRASLIRFPARGRQEAPIVVPPRQDEGSRPAAEPVREGRR